jgi:hypothetical protein
MLTVILRSIFPLEDTMHVSAFSETGLLLLLLKRKEYNAETLMDEDCVDGIYGTVDTLLDAAQFRHEYGRTFFDFDMEGVINPAEKYARKFAADVELLNKILTDYLQYGASPLDAWQYRESHRLQSVYRQLPARVRTLLRQKYNALGFQGLIISHYAHVCEDRHAKDFDTSSVRFIESEENGRREKYTTMRLGRYLQRYYKLPDAEIQEIVQLYRAELTPATYTLHFTTDTQRINEIFETEMSARGANSEHSSCMFGKFGHMDVRPYHVYSESPDVALAYITKDTDNSICARTVVNTKDKRIVRIYAVHDGDSTEHETKCTVLAEKLVELGYAHNGRALQGCRLRFLGYSDTDENSIIAPYLDNCGYVRLDEPWLVVCREADAEFSCCDTDGTGTLVGTRYRCNDCGDRVNEDDMFSDIDGNTICRDCIGFYVSAIRNRHGDEEYVRQSDAVQSCDGTWYTETYADVHLVERDGDYHPRDCEHLEIACDGPHCRFTSTDEDDFQDFEGNNLCDDCYESALNCECDTCGTEYDSSEMTELTDGTTHCTDCIDSARAELERKEYEREHQTTLAF